MSPPGIEPANLCILAGHLVRFAIEAVDYLCFKLVQYSEGTRISEACPNTWQYNL